MPVQSLRLAPTQYHGSGAVANSTASVSNSSNALTNVDSTTYAAIYGSDKYAVFAIPLWSRIPSGFTVDKIDCSIKFKARTARKTLNISLGKIVEQQYGGFFSHIVYEEVISFQPQTPSNTSAITIDLGEVYNRANAASWETNFANNEEPDNVYIGLKTNSTSSTQAFYIYGIELDVYSTAGEQVTVTSTLTGNGSIEPDGPFNIYTGEQYALTITPNNRYDIVNAEKDGVDITNDLVPHGEVPYTIKNLPGEYEKESGNWASVGGRFDIQATEWFEGVAGKGFDTTQSAEFCYGSISGTVKFAYPCPIENVPENAVLTRIYLKVNGRCAVLNKTGMAVRVKYGTINAAAWMSTGISESFNFSLQPDGTNDHVYTIECPILPPKDKLSELFVECEVGTLAYGAVINGFTLFAEFDYGDFVNSYTYTYEVTGNAQINVVITENPDHPKTMVKVKDEWVEIEKGYLKTDDGWLERDLNKILVPDGKYLKGN